MTNYANFLVHSSAQAVVSIYADYQPLGKELGQYRIDCPSALNDLWSILKEGSDHKAVEEL